jgi:hypothetical protein
LEHLNITPRIAIGSMVYRAGPDEVLDVVAFCGCANMAAAPNLFHMWLETENEIIDFSAGDWHAQMARTPEAGPEMQRPIEWAVEPPLYFWCPTVDLTEAWRSTGTPELGAAWYHEGVAADDHAAFVRHIRDKREALLADAKALWPAVRAALPPPLPRPPGRGRSTSAETNAAPQQCAAVNPSYATRSGGSSHVRR